MTTTTKELERAINKLWTTADVQRALGRSHQTIKTWRKDYNLPTVCIRGDAKPALRFVPEDVRAWARKYDLPVSDPA